MSATAALTPRPLTLPGAAGRAWALFRRRLHDRRFWLIQAIVIAISAGHTILEARHQAGLEPDLYLLPVSTYFIPVVYAGLNFGLEGAIPTAAWCCLLAAPNVVLFHRPNERWGVVLQLGIMFAVGVVIAARVERETTAKERAQRAGARLRALSAIGAATTSSLDLHDVLTRTVLSVLEQSGMNVAWIAYRSPGPDRYRELSAYAGRPPEPITLDGDLVAATDLVLRHAETRRRPGRGAGYAIVPIRPSGRAIGALGVASSGAVSDDDLALLDGVAAQLAVALENIRHFRDANRMVEELEHARAMLQNYVELATNAQEEERRRLARELHDDTIQTLLLARADLDAIAVEGHLPRDAGERLNRAQRSLAAAVDDVRRFSRDLRPSLLDDLGLADAVDALVGELRERTGIAVELVVAGRSRRIASEVEVAVFRIVQEALHNVERHSGARRARVRLDFRGPGVSVTVADDGRGFDPTAVLAGDGAGLGLLGIRERTKLVGASLSVRSRPGGGARLRVAGAGG